MARLTPEEKELAVWYADGVTEREMATWRNCSERTIKRAVADLKQTLAVSGLTVNRLLGFPIKHPRTLNEDLAKSL